MLQSSYKYSDVINAKGKEFSTESLFISLIFDQHKILLRNIVSKNSNILVKDNGWFYKVVWLTIFIMTVLIYIVKLIEPKCQ